MYFLCGVFVCTNRLSEKRDSSQQILLALKRLKGLVRSPAAARRLDVAGLHKSSCCPALTVSKKDLSSLNRTPVNGLASGYQCWPITKDEGFTATEGLLGRIIFPSVFEDVAVSKLSMSTRTHAGVGFWSDSGVLSLFKLMFCDQQGLMLLNSCVSFRPLLLIYLMRFKTCEILLF